MITVLDPRTKLPAHFPDAVAVCPNACPDDQCEAPERWLCIVGVRDGQPVCLGAFPPESSYVGCNCPVTPCPCGDPSNPGWEAFFDILEAWHGDPAHREAHEKAAARRQVLGLPEEPHHKRTGRERLAALRRHAPHLAQHLTHWKEAPDADIPAESPRR